MARDENQPFERGETFYNGGTIDTNNLGGTNYEGREYVFESNRDPANPDAAGRPVRVKVVRNVSGVNLKPGRIAHFSAASTAPYEGRVDGYTYAAGDRPAGIVDELLPAAGVPNNDLFYLVIGGPTYVVQGATTAASFVIGDRLVPAVYGATAGDDLGGRAGEADLTGATTPLAIQIKNQIGYAAFANSTAAATLKAVVKF